MSENSRRRNYTIGLIAIAAFAVGVSGSLWHWADSSDADIRQAADNQVGHYSNPASIPVEGRCLDLSPPDQFRCLTPDREAARHGQRNERDLEAQQVVATWTKAMGLAAIIGMGVGIFGLGLVYKTFAATRDGNQIARENGQAQVRCYLSVVDCTLIYKRDQWHLGCTVKNTGQSPAIDVEWESDLAVVVTGCEDFDIVKPKPVRPRMLTDISPDEPEKLPISIFALRLTPDQLKVLDTGAQLTVRCILNITARDVFGELVRHEAAFIDFSYGRPNMNQVFCMTKAAKIDLTEIERLIAEHTTSGNK